MESDRSKKKSRLGAGGDLEIRKHRARPAVIHFQSDSFFEVCPILDSNRDLEVYRDVSYSEVVMRTILPFIFAAWIVMPTVSCAQAGKDFTSPGQLAPGVSQKAVLEASLGNPPPVGWKWQGPEKTRPPGGGGVHHTKTALFSTPWETHQVVGGETVETFAPEQ